MRRIQRRRIFLCRPLLVLFLSALCGCAAVPLDHGAWMEARGPDFRVKSRLGEKATVALLEDLELFRRVVLWATNAESLESPVPTNIYVFAGRSGFAQLGGERRVVGAFLGGLRDNNIIMQAGSQADSREILQHEYVHFVMRNATTGALPRWYDDGFAEYLSTVHVKRGRVVMGWYPEGRIDSFRYSVWIPLIEILEHTNAERWWDEKEAMFYAESWAFVHYLHNGREDGRDIRSDLSRYLQLIQDGADTPTAAQEALGQSVDSLNGGLRHYVYAAKFPALRIPAEVFAADVAIRTRAVPPAEIAADMGSLLLRLNRPADAQGYFERAVAGDPTLGRAHSGLGDALKFQDEWEAALPHYERAVEVSPDDPLCRLDLAEYWHDRARAIEDPEQRASLLKRAREHYVKSWRLDDGLPETYAMYGATYLLEGERPEKALEMLEQAESLLPSNLSIRVMVAEAYLELGRPAEALERARSVEAWAHPGTAEALRARQLIEASEAASSGPDSAPTELP